MKNKPVITTKYVFNEGYPILQVIHDDENDWQFLGDHDVTEEDAMVVSMEQILKYDDSLEEILTMRPGYVATRQSLKSPWDIESYE